VSLREVLDLYPQDQVALVSSRMGAKDVRRRKAWRPWQRGEQYRGVKGSECLDYGTAVVGDGAALVKANSPSTRGFYKQRVLELFRGKREERRKFINRIIRYLVGSALPCHHRL